MEPFKLLLIVRMDVYRICLEKRPAYVKMFRPGLFSCKSRVRFMLGSCKTPMDSIRKVRLRFLLKLKPDDNSSSRNFPKVFVAALQVYTAT